MAELDATVDAHDRTAADFAARAAEVTVDNLKSSTLRQCLSMSLPKDTAVGKGITDSSLAGNFVAAYLARMRKVAIADRMPLSNDTLLQLLQLKFHRLPLKCFMRNTNTLVDLPDTNLLTTSTTSFTSFLELTSAWAQLTKLLALVYSADWAQQQCGQVLAWWESLSKRNEPEDLERWTMAWAADYHQRLAEALETCSVGALPPPFLVGVGDALNDTTKFLQHRTFSKDPFAQQASWWTSAGPAVRWCPLPDDAPAPAPTGKKQQPARKPGKDAPDKKQDEVARMAARVRALEKQVREQKAPPAAPAPAPSPAPHSRRGPAAIWVEGKHYSLRADGTHQWIGIDELCTHHPCKMFEKNGTCFRRHDKHPDVTGLNYKPRN
jgi:hypothetical protein